MSYRGLILTKYIFIPLNFTKKSLMQFNLMIYISTKWYNKKVKVLKYPITYLNYLKV